MAETALREYFRKWCDESAPGRFGILTCDQNKLMCGMSILAERYGDGFFAVNNFHWPGDDVELRVLLKVLPWERVRFVSEGHSVESLTSVIDTNRVASSFERVVCHKTLGVGPVVYDGNDYVECVFGGIHHSFSAGDVLMKGILTDIIPMEVQTAEGGCLC